MVVVKNQIANVGNPSRMARYFDLLITTERIDFLKSTLSATLDLRSAVLKYRAEVVWISLLSPPFNHYSSEGHQHQHRGGVVQPHASFTKADSTRGGGLLFTSSPNFGGNLVLPARTNQTSHQTYHPPSVVSPSNQPAVAITSRLCKSS